MPSQIAINRIGNGLYGNGVNNHVVIPHKTIFDMSSTDNKSFIITLLPLTPNASASFVIPLSKLQPITGAWKGWLIYLYATGQISFSLISDALTPIGATFATDAGAVPVGQISQVAINKVGIDPANWSIYVNGISIPRSIVITQLNNMIASSVTTTTTAVNVYRRDPNVVSSGTDIYKGYMYDLKWFGGGNLTPEEIKFMAKNDGATIPSSARAKLTDWWSFEQKSGTPLISESGSNNGAMSGFITSLGSTNQWVDSIQKPILI
jgi:hypothetical protein